MYVLLAYHLAPLVFGLITRLVAARLSTLMFAAASGLGLAALHSIWFMYYVKGDSLAAYRATFHDTYYVIAPARGLLLLFIVFTVLGLAQRKSETRDADDDIGAKHVLFWLTLVALAGANGLLSVILSYVRPSGVEAMMRTINAVNMAGTVSGIVHILSLTALIALVVIPPLLGRPSDGSR